MGTNCQCKDEVKGRDPFVSFFFKAPKLRRFLGDKIMTKIQGFNHVRPDPSSERVRNMCGHTCPKAF